MGIADEFEAAVGEIVETVSAAATELEAPSGSLTRTAETTQHLSTTVAAASEQVRSSATMPAVEGSKLEDEVRRFLMNVRTGPLDRRETCDPSYTGPERRIDRVAVRKGRAAWARRRPRPGRPGLLPPRSRGSRWSARDPIRLLSSPGESARS
jgi:hypothetical protein